MATPNKNAKSQLTTVRVPHDVMELMEGVKQPGESNAGFIVTAMRGEISRRQLSENGESKLLSSLDAALQALTRIEEIGERAGTDIRAIVDIAHVELEARQRKKSKDNPDQ
ncbi:TPA: hypothetical protein I8612_000193 [Citrobacter koseri]|nr:hypothetical protein [Citrobacter koseri]